MNRPEFIELTPEKVTVDTVSQELYHVSRETKAGFLIGFLKKEAPKNAIIFSNTRHGAEKLARRFNRNGFNAKFLTGDLPQNRRIRVMNDFVAGRFSYLVATDVAARGLHVQGLEMVVNYDLPQDIENYVHRIGRTGRAGRSGKAVSLVCERYAEKAGRHRILHRDENPG